LAKFWHLKHLNKNNLIDQYTFSFELPIWKLLYDNSESTENMQYLAIETRDKERVTWSVVNVETNETVWQQTPPETNWWTTLSGFSGQYIVLDCYSGTNEPTPSQKIYLDKTTGQVIEKPTLIINNPKNHWRNLTIYQDSDVYYDTISRFIDKMIGQKCQNSIFYGEIAENIILVYYICNSSTSALSPFLLVVSSKKTVLLHKPIEGGCDNVFSESCIYNQNQLIYLSGLNELTILRFC
jgi:Domain of unknown function (DUF4905)